LTRVYNRLTLSVLLHKSPQGDLKSPLRAYVHYLVSGLKGPPRRGPFWHYREERLGGVTYRIGIRSLLGVVMFWIYRVSQAWANRSRSKALLNWPQISAIDLTVTSQVLYFTVFGEQSGRKFAKLFAIASKCFRLMLFPPY